MNDYDAVGFLQGLRNELNKNYIADTNLHKASRIEALDKVMKVSPCTLCLNPVRFGGIATAMSAQC